ncbi:hypothetical protein M427DRAFT_135569 [Gonapodya prolifera JEL478]|uniref:Uncharacterized protein n=1 Tax=Gonapodya prolifera (strain JEL478) TaxID=1344416 RepID=A0A139ACV2_GONPJ|nr:hypothetical protein M427DRAFT_135569 [Gonapodya prolifera JEL478]|eukprot:KXS14642.1 hypothetical protein M427DRAFT_135569 [Gonapodya prolifera JEL478]
MVTAADVPETTEPTERKTVSSETIPNDPTQVATTPEYSGYATEWTEDSPLRQPGKETSNATLSGDSTKSFSRKGHRFQSFSQRGFGQLRKLAAPPSPVFWTKALSYHSPTASAITWRDRAVQATLWKF